ncbi:hypothetical protein F6R98_10350 [Candidatus Methylospira mobilis]|uniref:Uncharacterized protein n=1 Tax=Candidatus Methylospira mobilis TaxID=1808979 RepID=A0A5Q0BL83_9GAMM|nr:hypothetical protein [Candidatus Methylospira mobilis]QFY42964.1 hypothetical protein F6R98_10350 [Candidatus Methylospira mobilis]
MNQILLLIEIPEWHEGYDYRRLDTFQRNLKSKLESAPEGYQAISDSAYLLPAKSGLLFLSHIVDCADRAGYAYRALYLNDDQSWIS